MKSQYNLFGKVRKAGEDIGYRESGWLRWTGAFSVWNASHFKPYGLFQRKILYGSARWSTGKSAGKRLESEALRYIGLSPAWGRACLIFSLYSRWKRYRQQDRLRPVWRCSRSLFNAYDCVSPAAQWRKSAGAEFVPAVRVLPDWPRPVAGFQNYAWADLQYGATPESSQHQFVQQEDARQKFSGGCTQKWTDL